jgi:hypothetical protein
VVAHTASEFPTPKEQRLPLKEILARVDNFEEILQELGVNQRKVPPISDTENL